MCRTYGALAVEVILSQPWRAGLTCGAPPALDGAKSPPSEEGGYKTGDFGDGWALGLGRLWMAMAFFGT